MSNEVERLGKSLLSWQVASKSSASVAHQTAIGGKSRGDLREFSRFFHYLFTRKVHKQDFSGRAVRKKRISTAIAAPTALRQRATCPTCHSGICHGFLSHRRGLFRCSVIFERSRKWWGASAVVAALWSDKPLHIHCAMAYHLHQCRKLWVQGCLQYYRLPAPYLWP